MSRLGLVPFFRDWFDDVDRSHSLYDQYFGQGLVDEDLAYPVNRHAPVQYYPRIAHHGHHGHSPQGHAGPLRPTFDRHRSGLSHVANEKNRFEVNLDVHQFKPTEITVKTVDNFVIIEGRHEEKEDEHGYIQRHFVRKYSLPEGVKSDDVTSALSSDGVLSITAPKKPAIDASGERMVPIEFSNQRAIMAGAVHSPPPPKVAVKAAPVAAATTQNGSDKTEI